MTKTIYVIYNPEIGCVEVSIDDRIHISFDYKKCNSTVHFDVPNDITYLLKLAGEEPGFYAELAAKDGGLQGYVEAMEEFN